MTALSDKLQKALDDRIARISELAAEYRMVAQVMEAKSPKEADAIARLAEVFNMIASDYRVMKLWVENYEKIVELYRRQLDE